MSKLRIRASLGIRLKLGYLYAVTLDVVVPSLHLFAQVYTLNFCPGCICRVAPGEGGVSGTDLIRLRV